MHQFLFYNEFIILLYMFRAQPCSSSGGKNCITQHLASSHPEDGRLMHRRIERPPAECDDARCCVIQFLPPDDEHGCARNM